MMKTKLFVSFCLFVIVTLLFPVSALAQGITVGGTVKEGEVVDNNLILYGPTVVMDGVINGDLVAIGENITINGEVNGSLIIAGKDVVLNGPVSGSVYSAALTLELGPEAVIERDVYFAGGVLTMQEGSAINRDLNVISLEAGLNGTVGRQVNALVGPLSLIQAFYKLVTGQDLNLLGLVPPSQAFLSKPEGFSLPAVAGLPAPKNLLMISPVAVRYPSWAAGLGSQIMPQEGTIDPESLKTWGFPFLRNFVALLILGLLLVWLAPEPLTWSAQQVRVSPWRALLNGLLVFVFGWIVAILTSALVLALTIFLFWVSLPYLGLLVGMFGLLTIGVSVTVFLFSIAFFSKLIVIYLVTHLLFKRFLPKYAESKVLLILVGILLYALLVSIPYLGWLVAVIATLIGLGAIWMVANTRQVAVVTTPSPEPVVDSVDPNLVSEG